MGIRLQWIFFILVLVSSDVMFCLEQTWNYSGRFAHPFKFSVNCERYKSLAQVANKLEDICAIYSTYEYHYSFLIV